VTGVSSMADLRRKYVRRGNEIVSRGTISFDATVRPLCVKRGLGVDWTPAEVEVLKRKDISPDEMRPLLPGRTDRAIRLKRHRLGLCRKYQKTVRV
jgi:hypothetical protein